MLISAPVLIMSAADIGAYCLTYLSWSAHTEETGILRHDELADA